MTMKKQVISLTQQQVDWLDKESDRLGISIAEIVRRAVDDYRDCHLCRISNTASVKPEISPKKK